MTATMPAEIMGKVDIDRLKASIDILDLVSSYVSVKKYGATHKALCPFHDEKTPSFVIYTDSQTYHCYGCGAHGDVLDFVGEIEKLSFGDVLKRLRGNNYLRDVSTPTIPRAAPTPRPKPVISPEMIVLYTKVWEVARDTLLTNLGREAEDVRGYLEGRGFRNEDLVKTEFGAYLPALREYVLQNYPEQLAKESGLVSHGMGYNFQVVMPHFNAQGQVAGLTFRLNKEGLDWEGKPLKKYKHTPHLDKSFLYNLYRAATAIKIWAAAVIVEGHLDVQSLILLGVEHAVCLGGNSLNKEQIEHLLRYGAKNFILWLDGDDRGQDGCAKAVYSITENNNARAYVVVCDKYKDVGEINKVAERHSVIVKCLGSVVAAASWLGKHLSFVNNDMEKDDALLNAKEIYTKYIKDPIQKREFLKSLAKGLSYKLADIESQFTDKSAVSKKTSPSGASGSAVIIQRINEVMKTEPNLSELENFLKLYRAQNFKVMRSEAKGIINHINGVKSSTVTFTYSGRCACHY